MAAAGAQTYSDLLQKNDHRIEQRGGGQQAQQQAAAPAAGQATQAGAAPAYRPGPQQAGQQGTIQINYIRHYLEDDDIAELRDQNHRSLRMLGMPANEQTELVYIFGNKAMQYENYLPRMAELVYWANNVIMTEQMQAFAQQAQQQVVAQAGGRAAAQAGAAAAHRPAYGARIRAADAARKVRKKTAKHVSRAEKYIDRAEAIDEAVDEGRFPWMQPWPHYAAYWFERAQAELDAARALVNDDELVGALQRRLNAHVAEYGEPAAEDVEAAQELEGDAHDQEAAADEQEVEALLAEHPELGELIARHRAQQ